MAVLIVLPSVALTLAMMALIGQLAFLAFSALGRNRETLLPAFLPPDIVQTDTFLSVHIPACREPPEVLIDTLASLQRQTAAVAHECIVIINNTPDRAAWQPVSDWCAAVGAPFRFLRQDHVTGAKAGALNIALAHCDPRTTHIVTVDADYQVEPTFLADVASEIAVGGCSFYQYPQAYRDVTPRSAGIARELEDYFKRQALAANLGQAMLLTGTLSVISKPALIYVGGWPTASCTEDAALGARLIGAGYHGVYVDRVVGRGLMPLDLAGLHQQRHRWASGNARVLAQWLSSRPRSGSFWGTSAFFRNLLIVSQLVAWLNFGVIATVTLLAGLAHLALNADAYAAPGLAWALIWVSAAALAATVMSALPVLMQSPSRAEPLSVRMTAFWSRIAMLPVAGAATLVGILPLEQEFKVTPKTATTKGARRARRHLSPIAVTTGLGLCVIAASVWTGHPAALMSAGMMVLPVIGALVSANALRVRA